MHREGLKGYIADIVKEMSAYTSRLTNVGSQFKQI